MGRKRMKGNLSQMKKPKMECDGRTQDVLKMDGYEHEMQSNGWLFGARNGKVKENEGKVEIRCV